MHTRTERQHVIDFVFPIALFFVFAASSLVVVILAASVYQKTTASSERNYELRTSLDYVAEKIRQSDASDLLSVGTFDGCESLIIQHKHGTQSYVTYIYKHDGYLKELFIQEGVNVSASSGTPILAVSSFHISQTSDGCFRLFCETEEGQSEVAVIAVRSDCAKGGTAHEF